MDEKWRLLNEQIAYARANSRFYASLPEAPVTSREELAALPTVTERDLRERGGEMLCCPPNRVRRMVTMFTSGTTAAPKRLAFTEADLERTVDFFRWGMHTLCETGETVGVFMPGSSPDGLCDLLSRGIRGFGGVCAVYGVIEDYDGAAAFCLREKPAVLVGIPAQMRALALTHPELRPRRVLLSADYIAASTAETIRRRWQCEVYVHYGMTESGLGCAVETPARQGMIPREDVLLETSPAGEILLTTLRREAMPLIRYRTGDLGTVDQRGRLLAVYGRMTEAAKKVSVMALDAFLFAQDGVLDYAAALRGDQLELRVLGEWDALPEFPGITVTAKRVDSLEHRGKRQVEVL